MGDNVDTALDKHLHKVDTIYDVDIYQCRHCTCRVLHRSHLKKLRGHFI